MEAISQDRVVEVIRKLNAMSFAEKEQAVDRLHQSQPHVLAYALGLKHDISLPVLDHVLHLVLFIHEAFQGDRNGFPQISLDALTASLLKHAEMLNFIDSAPEGMREDSIALTVHAQKERNVLAWTVGYLQDHGLIGESDEQTQVICAVKTILDAYTRAKWQAPKEELER